MQKEQEAILPLVLRLQTQLKKQFIFIEKQQQEKVKLKREIEQNIKKYYQEWLTQKSKFNKFFKDDGFDNCYNFIKDMIIAISSDYHLGKKIIEQIEVDNDLISIFANMFYDSIETDDVYRKNIVRLTVSLAKDLIDPSVQPTQKAKIMSFLRHFMDREEHRSYFQGLAHRTFQKLISLENISWLARPISESAKSEISLEDQYPECMSPMKSSKRSSILGSSRRRDMSMVVDYFMEQLTQEAELCPLGIKILIRVLCRGGNNLKNNKQVGRVWKFISYFYLKAFERLQSSGYLTAEQTEIIIKLKERLKQEYGFSLYFHHESIFNTQLQIPSNDFEKIIKLMQYLTSVNGEKYKQLLQEKQNINNNQIRIHIYGGCFSFWELRCLMKELKKIESVLHPQFQKLYNRVNKIYSISPNLAIFLSKNDIEPHRCFVLISQLLYEESIQSDYYRYYSELYKNSNQKHILKQALVQMNYLHNYNYKEKSIKNGYDIQLQDISFNKNKQINKYESQQAGIVDIFEGIIKLEAEQSFETNLTPQLLMKIKYLVWLMKKNQKNFSSDYIFAKDMLQDLQQRNQINLKLFQDTKFSLLKVYNNLKTFIKLSRQKTKASNLRQSQLTLIDHLSSEITISLCLTTPSTRNNMKEDESTDFKRDKFKFQIAHSQDIIIKDLSQCIHKDNIFMGREFHVRTVEAFLDLFASLPQVKYTIANPEFLLRKQSHEKRSGLYIHPNKIKKTLQTFIDLVIQQQKKQSPNSRKIVQELIYRSLSQKFLGFPSVSTKIDVKELRISKKDHIFNDNILEIKNALSYHEKKSQIYERESHENKLSKKVNKIKENSEEFSVNNIIEIGTRYIKQLPFLRTPIQKMSKLKQLQDIFRTFIPKPMPAFEKLYYRAVIKADSPNLISTLCFIELFLPEEKLMATEGRILDDLKKVVSSIYHLDVEKYMEESLQKHTKESLQNGIQQQSVKDILLEGRAERLISHAKNKHKFQI